MSQLPNSPPVKLAPPQDEGSTRCVTEGCGKERQWKGLCRSCYGQARRLIDQGKTSWEELAEMGLVVEDDKPFVAAYKRRKREAVSLGEGPAPEAKDPPVEEGKK